MKSRMKEAELKVETITKQWGEEKEAHNQATHIIFKNQLIDQNLIESLLNQTKILLEVAQEELVLTEKLKKALRLSSVTPFPFVAEDGMSLSFVYY